MRVLLDSLLEYQFACTPQLTSINISAQDFAHYAPPTGELLLWPDHCKDAGCAPVKHTERKETRGKKIFCKIKVL